MNTCGQHGSCWLVAKLSWKRLDTKWFKTRSAIGRITVVKWPSTYVSWVRKSRLSSVHQQTTQDSS